MAQHFLLSRAAKSLSLASIFTMKDAEAENGLPARPLAGDKRELVCPQLWRD